MKIETDVPDSAIIDNLNTVPRSEWFLEVHGLPGAGTKVLRPFRVHALDPKTDKPHWYTVSLSDVQRGVALFIVRAGSRGIGFVSGGWSNNVGHLVEGALDTAASDLLLQFMVWGEEVYS